ncbi:MAG: NAD(P)/FAD-dependent oxidoreductase [Clostridia bacterium]|nr:NAD(P)/FAD-dependent oxidoreductase [Clostridia bacterium]
MSKVVVIGGGPAGVLCACTAAANGNSVTLIERNLKIGRKLMITGKGRCNVTNFCTDPKEVIDQVPVNGSFLYSALSSFMTYDTMELFESLGVPLKVERGNRVFPESDKSSSIVDALAKYLKQCGVNQIHGRVSGLIFDSDGEKKTVKGVQLENGESIFCDKVVIATGGLSYKATGSDGDGYRLAESAGHEIIDPVPSLVPIESDDNFCKRLQGLSLKNISIRIVDNKSGKAVYKDFGEMLFTHFGVSGPVILSASSHIRNIRENQYTLFIDLKPALSEEQLDFRIRRDFDEQLNKDFGNSLGGLLPSKIIPVVVEKTQIPSDKKVNQLTKQERHALVYTLKNFTVSLSAFRPINEAIITSGGVCVKEINPKTMESKLTKNLFFAGEVIDVDAYTGGFNIQIAFSTGHLAGESV